MQIKRFLLIVSLFTGFLLLNTTVVKACQCVGPPTIIDSLETSENVIIAAPASIEKASENEWSGKVKMTVKKVFKGALKEGETVVFRQGSGSDCGWEFDEKSIGTELLIYDTDSFSRMTMNELPRKIDGCGRSRDAKGAVSDFLYLENLEKVRGKTRIYGSVWFYAGREIAAGRKIRITGAGKTFETVTDKNGIYEIYDLPPGEYFIEPEIPKGWLIRKDDEDMMRLGYSGKEFPNDEYPNRFSVTLRAQKDASQDFLFAPDNSIRGRIVEASGKPLVNICLEATEVSEAEYKYPYRGCTNEQGEFEITSLDRNRYILTINGDGKMSPEQPIKTLFYPGVKDRAQATVVSIAEGQNIVLKDFKVSEFSPILTLSGKLLYSDGTPVKGKYVEFFPDKKDENLRGSSYGYPYFKSNSKDDGSFSIRIFKGQTGRLKADIEFEKGKLETCPEIGKSVTEERTYYVTVSSPIIEIKADKDLTDIRLVLPFPPCRQP